MNSVQAFSESEAQAIENDASLWKFTWVGMVIVVILVVIKSIVPTAPLVLKSEDPVMVSTWDLSLPGCNTQDIILPVLGSKGVVDWGDGSPVVRTGAKMPKHSYDDVGTFEITFSGVFDSFSMGDAVQGLDAGDMIDGVMSSCLVSIDEWGETGTTDLSYAFVLAKNLEAVASPPSTVTILASAFSGLRNFNASLEHWDVSQVSDMGHMFSNATSFDQPLATWDVSGVEVMQGMFGGARTFDQPLSTWDTSSVQDMNGMFTGAESYSYSLGEWATPSEGVKNFGLPEGKQPGDGWAMNGVDD